MCVAMYKCLFGNKILFKLNWVLVKFILGNTQLSPYIFYTIPTILIGYSLFVLQFVTQSTLSFCESISCSNRASYHKGRQRTDKRRFNSPGRTSNVALNRASYHKGRQRTDKRRFNSPGRTSNVALNRASSCSVSCICCMVFIKSKICVCSKVSSSAMDKKERKKTQDLNWV